MKLAEHIDTGARCGPAQDLSEPLTKAAAKEEMLGVAGLLRSATRAGALSAVWAQEPHSSALRQKRGRKACDQAPARTERHVNQEHWSPLYRVK